MAASTTGSPAAVASTATASTISGAIGRGEAEAGAMGGGEGGGDRLDRRQSTASAASVPA